MPAQPSRHQWKVPAETATVDRCWIAFPPTAYLSHVHSWQASSARRAWARVAQVIRRYVPVGMLVDPRDMALAETYLSTAEIDLVPIHLDSGLMGRFGPTFVLADPLTSGAGRPRRRKLGLVDWEFNGYGRTPGVHFQLDNALTGTLLEDQDLISGNTPRLFSSLVVEGGSWVSDGAGTVIASEEILLDPRRNPGWTHHAVERELKRKTGAKTVIWLPQGLARNSGRHGTGGHIDQLVNFVAPGQVLLHMQTDPTHPDHQTSVEAEALLSSALDASGNRLAVIPIAAPDTHSDAYGPVNWSYVDYRIFNEAVIFPRFVDTADSAALELYRALFPDREIVPVLVQELYDRNASIRAVALPQPKPGYPDSSAA